MTPEPQPGASYLSLWKDTQMASAWSGTGVEDGELPWTWDEWVLREAGCSWGLGEGSSSLFLWFVPRAPARKEDGPRLG